MRVGIVGAGIGGLSLALQLHRRGIACVVWEAVRDLKPLGVGINLLPHATRELSELGLGPGLQAIAIETSALAYYNKHGQRIWHEPRGRAAGYEWPQFSIHRGQFQMLLLEAVRARLGAEAVQTGLRAESFEHVEGGVSVRFARREGGSNVHTVDVLVVAEGIHSVLRRQLFPDDQLRFGGRMLWRAAVEAEPYLDGRTMFMAGHQDQKFVCYPISEPLRREGRALINWIAELRVPSERFHDDWNRRVDKALFASAFADWKWDFIDVPSLIERTQAVYEFPMVDKDPLPRWSFGRLTLLGDAAHPMYPIGSNGSAQAIVDGRCLADCLSGTCRIEDALLAYEAERLPKTTAIVLGNRLNGPEQVMQLAEERAPGGFRDIHDVIPRHELEEIALRYKRIAGFDKQSLTGGGKEVA